MQFEGDLRKNQAPIKAQTVADSLKNLPSSDQTKEFVGVTEFGTPVVYAGDNKSLANSKENQEAMLALRAMNKGLTGKTSISLNTDTGNIKLTAPKKVLESEQGKKIVDNETLKAMSQAYKLNPNYKVSFTDVDKDGKEVTSNITIPEYIEKINDALENLASNMKNADAVRYALVKEFGDKAENMTDEQIRMSLDYEGDAIPIPEFAVNYLNNFKKMRNIGDYVTEGRIKKEDLKKFYTRDNLGRDEMAVLYANIKNRLNNAEWASDEFYKDEEGNDILNQNNINEMAKAIAFRNYILKNDPDATWWQSVGDNIESMALGALAGFDRVFFNIANVGQAIFTLGQGQEVQNYIKDMDKALSQYQQDQSLVNDATTTTYLLGNIAGAIAGTLAGGRLIKVGGADLGKVAGKIGSKALTSAAEAVDLGGKAATVSNVLELYKNAENVSKGTLVVLKLANAAQKAQIATGVAKAFLNNHKTLNMAVNFLLDTVHDALLYDSTTLREALQNSDQETRDYWLGQLADNAKWWAGMGAAKTMIKFAGKTTLGAAANVVLTKFNMKVQSWAGDKWSDIKGTGIGGTKMNSLQKKLAQALEDGDNIKARRIQNQIKQLTFDDVTRKAKKDLGNMKLDWDGLKLTDESSKRYQDAVTSVKALNNGFDAYNRNIEFKRQEMVGMVRDPATGKLGFINPDLGGANQKASEFYFDAAEKLNKYNLKSAPDSLFTQEMTDYMVSQYYLSLANAFVKAGGDKAADAAKAIPIIEQNIENARMAIPDDIAGTLDTALEQKTYQSFYAQYNEYGRSKGLLNKDKTLSYENNPIWKECGYMPIVTETTKTGHWVSDSGRVDATIDQDFNSINFNVKPGQHYVDPEIVRQTRINTMARTEVNRDLFKSYAGYGSNATNITKVSGEETEYVRKVTENKKALENAVDANASSFAQNFEVEIQKQRRRKPVKNEKINRYDVEEAVSILSLSDTSKLLTDKRVFKYDGQKLTDGVTRENYDEWFNKQSKKVKNYLDQQYSRMGRAGERGYDALQSSMQIGGDDFEAGLERAFLMGDADFAKSSTMNEAYRNVLKGQDAFYEGVIKTRAKADLRNVLNVNIDSLVDDLGNTIEKNLDTYIIGIMDNAGAKAALDTLSESANGADEVSKYLALRSLSDDKSAMEAAYRSIDKEIDSLKQIGSLEYKDVENIKKQAHYMFDSMLDQRIDDAANSARTINPDIVDNSDIFEKTRKLNEEIAGAEAAKASGDGTVMYLDSEGRRVFAQVDPAFASLYNYRFSMTKAEASVFAKTNAVMSKLFRYGTTSVNLSSFGNQMFKDFGNAVLVGGAWQTIKSNADNLVDVFGQNIVDQIKRFDPSGYEMRQVEKLAEQTGRTVEQAAVSRELMRGAAISPTTTERTLYKEFYKQMGGGNTDDVIMGMKNKLQSIIDKYNPDELLNGKRENYLRNRVYASSLNDAMKQGYTLEQSRVYAEFAMNNATTNFSRQLYHMQAIADSTPYFRAAINGSKSFWRMWSLDPVGISGRIMGGLILPTIYLTGASLANKDDREVYMNMPEYQKNGNLVFVHEGQVITIPIPEELDAIVSPFRQFVEYLNDANKNDFWELMQNDVLAFSPVDLTAFTTVDMDRVLNDPTILDRMGRGTSRVFSQMAPVPIKTAYMLATGIDPYTGKRLSDPSYSYWNDETNSVETMDYTQNAFAKWFAGLFGGNMSPYLAEKVVSGIIGTTGINVLADITALLQEGPEGWLDSAGTNATSQIAKPFYEDTYDLADSAWKRAVRELTAQKNAIMASDDYKTILKELSQEKDPEKRKNLSAELQNLVNEYQQQVATAVKRLGTEYQGTYDRKKFAATLQLLNFNTDPAYQTAIQATSDESSAVYYSGRDLAIRTMQRLGVDGTNDMSIFGYGVVNKDGEIEVKYSSPIAIMDATNIWNDQKDIHLANIKAAIKETGLWDARQAMKDQVDAIYNKGKLKDSDYDAINSIYINFNSRVMSAIAPYIQEMTPEAAINNESVLDYLENLIEVPSEYKKDKYGRYVTNKKLGKGSAKDAYVRNYIKEIFKVNDTGYSGGKNYSGRK